MAIGISPFTPTPLDRGDDRTVNPRQPRDPRHPDERHPESEKEDVLDAIEDAVPPTNPPIH